MPRACARFLTPRILFSPTTPPDHIPGSQGWYGRSRQHSPYGMLHGRQAWPNSPLVPFSQADTFLAAWPTYTYADISCAYLLPYQLKTNRNPPTNELHAPGSYIRSNMDFTLNLVKIPLISGNPKEMIFTKTPNSHKDTWLLHYPFSQQEIISANIQACIHAFHAWIQAFFSIIFVKKLIQEIKTQQKTNTEKRHHFSFPRKKAPPERSPWDALC